MRQRLTLRLLLVCLLALVMSPRDAFAQDTTAAFKQAVTQEKWQDAVKRVRDQVGTLKARAKSSAVPATNPPGAPAGDYVVFQFTSVFEQRATATETVTAVREADGPWRIVGYFVQ